MKLLSLLWLTLSAAQVPQGPQPAKSGAIESKPGGAQATGVPRTDRETSLASVPLPVRFGSLGGRPGEYVDYEVRRKGVKPFKVRASYVLDKVEEGHTLRQLEFDFIDIDPRVLVVLWILPKESQPIVTRLALWVPPQPPLSVPVDVALTSLEVRGISKQLAAKRIERGPFSGEAQQLTFATSSGKGARALASDRVPIFGVESVEFGDEQWTAVASGNGAQTMLHAVPLKVPRLPDVPAE